MTTNALDGMTQERWDRLTPAERDRIRDWSGLSPQLRGLEGFRVEVVRTDGERSRFIVGRSTGWRPCHLEIKTRRSLGGMSADREYQVVRPIGRVR